MSQSFEWHFDRVAEVVFQYETRKEYPESQDITRKTMPRIGGMATRTISKVPQHVAKNFSLVMTRRDSAEKNSYQINREKTMNDYSLGCKLPVAEWVHLNRVAIFKNSALRKYVSPFPPMELMQNTSGLTSEADFASHGADFWIALSQASPKPLHEFASILDFGCGCGRLARMFKGHTGRIAGCDIDARHVEWCSATLKYMETRLSSVRPPIPFADNEFDAVISISVFTHLNEGNSDQFLQELARVCRRDGMLFLTLHGRLALDRAISEPPIRTMLDVPEDLFQAARVDFSKGRHAFILQRGHLTTVDKPVGERLLKGDGNSDNFEYGITFVPEEYVHTKWSRWFEVVDYRVGALHDFQDIVVLRPKK
jgi:SAM-dependent methyltransferase